MSKKDRIINIVISTSISFVLCLVVTVTADYLYNANQVSYSNTHTGMTSDNVQGAVDELYSHATDYTEIRKMIYPVGSIYLSVEDDTVAKVEARFGGTWEVFGEGEALVGVKTSDTDFATVEKQAGSKSQSYTPAGTNSGGAVSNHTLTVSQIPSHSHSIQIGGKAATYSAAYTVGTNRGGIMQNGTAYTTLTITSTGGGGAHNHGFTQPKFTGTAATISHLQPYVTVYMYKRTA